MAQASQVTWIERFATGFQRFQAETGKEVPDLLRDLMRVFVEKLYHWTAPPTQGHGRTGRSGGLESVEYDINRFAISVNQQWLEALYKRFGPGPVTGEYRTRNGRRLYLQDALIEADTSAALSRIRPHHTSLRDKKGRVRSVQRGEGDWRKVMILSKEAKESYIKEVKKRVGKLKAGWLPALKGTKSKLPPTWVVNASQIFESSGKVNGFYDESSIDQKNWTGFIEAENDAQYFRDPTRFMFRARDHIEKFVMKSQFDKWIQQMIDKHGAKT